MAAAGAVWEDKFGDGTRAYVDMRVVGSRNSNGRYSGVSIRAKPLLAAKKIGTCAHVCGWVWVWVECGGGLWELCECQSFFFAFGGGVWCLP